MAYEQMQLSFLYDSLGPTKNVFYPWTFHMCRRICYWIIVAWNPAEQIYLWGPWQTRSMPDERALQTGYAAR
jgi:hypothetical protein